jgi:hypothetical protein
MNSIMQEIADIRTTTIITNTTTEIHRLATIDDLIDSYLDFVHTLEACPEIVDKPEVPLPNDRTTISDEILLQHEQYEEYEEFVYESLDSDIFDEFYEEDYSDESAQFMLATFGYDIIELTINYYEKYRFWPSYSSLLRQIIYEKLLIKLRITGIYEMFE